MGTKKEYNEKIHTKIVSKLSAYGYTMPEIAKTLDISVTLLYEWIKKFPKFAYAIENGKSTADKEVIAALHKKCIGYSYFEEYFEPIKSAKTGKPTKKMIISKKIKKRIQPDIQSIEFWLCNRNKKDWQKSSNIEIGGKMDFIITPAVNPAINSNNNIIAPNNNNNVINKADNDNSTIISAIEAPISDNNDTLVPVDAYIQDYPIEEPIKAPIKPGKLNDIINAINRDFEDIK
jgi:hypothetical protein